MANIYLANILGQLLDEVGIRKWGPSLAPWSNVSIMDAIEKKYSHCIFCSRDFNEELWRNINGANTPLCTHCCIGRLTACSVELLVLEAFSLKGVKWYNPHNLLSNHFLLCPITNKYASIVIMLDTMSCNMKVVRQHNLHSLPQTEVMFENRGMKGLVKTLNLTLSNFNPTPTTMSKICKIFHYMSMMPCAVLNDLGLSGLRMPVGHLICHNLVFSLLTRRKMDTIPLHSDIITSLQHAIGFRSIVLLPALHNFQNKVAANKIPNTRI